MSRRDERASEVARHCALSFRLALAADRGRAAVMPPVAHPNAVTLWKSTSVEAWRTAIEAYDARLDALNRGERLKALDAFVRIELPRRVKSRAEKGGGSRDSGARLFKDEYVKVVDWKLSRGKFRPGLMKYARALDDDAIVRASKEAFALAHSKDGRKGKGDLVDAMNPLIALRGCGPATASAFMSCADDRFPFFSDEALAVVIGNGNNDKDRYSLPRYREFMKALQQRSDELGAEDLTASKLETALWSAAALTMPRKASGRKSA